MNFIRKFFARLTKSREVKPRGRIVGTMRTRDAFDYMAFQFRMATGFAGDVNRTHPAGIEACLVDTANPPVLYGLAVMADAASPNGIRTIATGDSTATDIYGVTVRPYPTQPSGQDAAYGQANFGNEAPATIQAIDVLKSGYIMVALQGATAATKGGAVFVQTTATSGNNLQGGFSAVTASGAIALSSRSYWNGPAGADGIAELALHVG